MPRRSDRGSRIHPSFAGVPPLPGTRFVGPLALAALLLAAEVFAAPPSSAPTIPSLSALAADPGADQLPGLRARHRFLENPGRIPRGYREARQFMFSSLDNENGEVEGLYTGIRRRTRGIPDPTVMNTEHVWAQSWFRRQLPSHTAERARADLHHLFPSDSRVNAIRGSLPFGDVTSSQEPLPGGSECDGERFEPRDPVKGDVARAIFYFANEYDVPVPNGQERILRVWHRQDPVSEREARREQRIREFQGNHNPFVQHPALVETIVDF